MGINRNTKGQVSIFLVFLFQVLFVFFAMVVNVGLLVYYKINLQNSVDLAAYYAAMKQAEMLNTIGHINYQLRQNWKLVSYRTMILGSLGPDTHPARPRDSSGTSFKQAPAEVFYGAPTGRKYPVFCVTIAELFANVIGTDGTLLNEEDNQCRVDTNHQLSGFKIPDVIWTLPGYNEKIRDGAIALQNKFLNEFAGGGFRNYNNLAAFIIMFRADSLNRRKVIGVLANTMSQDTSNFFDLDGAGVTDGARKVLQKNLADQNSSGITMNLYNSLASPGCGGPNSDIELLPGWLKEVEVMPLFAYMDSGIDDNVFDGPGKAGQGVRYIGYDLDSMPSEAAKIQGSPAFEILKGLNDLMTIGGLPQHSAGRWTTAIGVEKNPWCMPYVGIKASSKPRLPFMPDRFSPTLQAKTFAKPFGSRIGPWFGRTWPDRTTNTTSDKNVNVTTDMRLPPRIYDGMVTPPFKSPNDLVRFTPTYSRFVGDNLSLLSEQIRWAYGKFYWSTPSRHPFWTAMWKQPLIEAFDKNRADNSPFFMGPMSGDILADAYQPKFFPPLETAVAMQFARQMRASEIAAIAPDLFDVTYYSIEPRFNQYILPRLQRYIQTFNSKRPHLMVRGDFGWRHPTYPGEPGVADESANVEMQTSLFKSHPFYLQTRNEIYQTIADPAQYLTSWAETSIIDYNPAMTSNKIGNCNSGARVPAGTDPWTPGACVSGGRTGYSVKLVSKKFLESSIPDIGGTGVSGTILNPPDPSF